MFGVGISCADLVAIYMANRCARYACKLAVGVGIVCNGNLIWIVAGY